mmetsp:Transcript_21840/g.56968  ORF Transcript_21840/g.56968 Transcript_21840/m.56968 type:complete len:99 (+) Transcript_21840:1188-1484(+)
MNTPTHCELCGCTLQSSERYCTSCQDVLTESSEISENLSGGAPAPTKRLTPKQSMDLVMVELHARLAKRRSALSPSPSPSPCLDSTSEDDTGCIVCFT